MGSFHSVQQQLVLLFLFCSFFALVITHVEGCHAPERQALLSLQSTMSVSARHVSWPNWDEHGAECCEWQGVTCDEVTGRVISLELRRPACDFRKELSCSHDQCGSLPSSLARLESLQVLDLQGGCFSGAIPGHTFASFTNLTYLDLSRNSFSKANVSPLQQFPKLTYLNLSYNPIPILDHVSQLVRSSPNLMYLDLQGLFASGSIPLELSAAFSPHLVHLDLSNNRLYGVIPEHLISSLQNLAYLDLSYNEFQNPVPWQSLGGLSRLRHLSLGNGGGEALLWEESKADWACTWKALESLSCENMGFTSNLSTPFCLEDPAIVSKLKSLSFTSSPNSVYIGALIRTLSLANESLSLKSFSLSSRSSREFNHLIPPWSLPNESISLSLSSLQEFQLHPPSWLHSLNAPFLETLDLSFNGLTSIPLWLQQFPLLQSLDISSNSISDLSVLHRYPRLKSLDVSGCNVSEFPHGLLLDLPYLETLNMHGNRLKQLPSGLENLVHLRELYLSFNQLNDTLYQGLLQNSTQLTSLTLEGNHISGGIPQSLLKPSLLWLDLSGNRLSGMIPFSIGNLSLLNYLDLSQNLLSGVIPFSIGNLSLLSRLDLSHNRLSGVIPFSIGSLSLLNALHLSFNRLSGVIPFSIGSLSLLQELDLSSNLLSGVLPVSMGNLSLLSHLDLSSNKFSGSLPRAFENSLSLRRVDLSNNRFSGSLRLEVFHNCASLLALDLSSNNFKGALHEWETANSSKFLNLLNLGKNSFSSGIPASVGQLHYLEYLILDNNKFSGAIPTALQNCTLLTMLDLNYNHLTGGIPKWITGENFHRLQVLILSNNQFEGSIPSPLVQNLTDLQILALANNLLSGSIPNNLDQLQGMAKRGKDLDMDYASSIFGLFSFIKIPVPSKGSDREVGGFILAATTCLDLSNNSLEGTIPPQIGALKALYSLNLSHNNLSGPIPSRLGELSGALESLDLSHNRLTGGVPRELCSLHGLGAFDISSNRLQGEIPESCTQIYGFNASSFAGNDGLCGSPLPNQCPTAPPAQNTGAPQGANLPQKQSIIGKLQEYIVLEGVGIGHCIGFVSMGLFLYFKYWHR